MNGPEKKGKPNRDQRPAIRFNETWLNGVFADRTVGLETVGVLLTVIARLSCDRTATIEAGDEVLAANGLRRDGTIRRTSRRWVAEKLNALCARGYLERRPGGTYGLSPSTASAVTLVSIAGAPQ